MSTRSGGSTAGAATVRESASRRYSTPKGAEKAPTLTANGARVGRPPKSASGPAHGLSIRPDDVAYREARARMTPQELHQEMITRLQDRLATEERIGMGHTTMAEANRREIARYQRGDVAPPRPSRTPAHETPEERAIRTHVDYHRQETWLNYGPGTKLTGQALVRAADRRSSALHTYLNARQAMQAAQQAPAPPRTTSKAAPTRDQLVTRIARARSDIARYQRSGDTKKRDAAIDRHDRLTAQLRETPA